MSDQSAVSDQSLATAASAPPLVAKVAAEAIGTFALVFAGCGAIMVDASHGGVLGHGGVCAVFGLVIAVMIYATGHISGAHFNPAVTLAFAATGHLSWREVPVYIVGQCAAAVLGAAVLYAVLGPVAGVGATVPVAGVTTSLIFESVLTFFLMFVITAVATDPRADGALAGVAIGATVALGALVGGPICGASMNPARSLGPALVTGQWADFWVYVAGPIVGAIAGAFAYRAVR